MINFICRLPEIRCAHVEMRGVRVRVRVCVSSLPPFYTNENPLQTIVTDFAFFTFKYLRDF